MAVADILINKSGLVVNSYRDAEGRGAYFPGSAGTSEGQFLFMLGCLDAFKATGNPLAKQVARKTLLPILTTIYRNGAVPNPVTATNSFAPHWLFNAKYPFVSATIQLYRTFNFADGVATVPANAAEPFRNFFNVRSADSEYLWENPYSALRAGSFFPTTSVVENSSGAVTVTLQDTSFNGPAYITYSTLSGPTIQVGENFEAWPDWRQLIPGEIACAVDVFVWARKAFLGAYEVFGEPTWLLAAQATEQQARIAFDINDSRDWIKPTYTKNPFSDGSMFSFVTRLPAPRFASDDRGRIEVYAQSTTSGGELQVGNADRKDFYREGDATEFTIGTDRPMGVRAYIDLYQEYSEANRYFTDIPSAGPVTTYTKTRTDFVNAAGGVLPLDSPVYTVGFDLRDTAAFKLVIERVRQTPASSTEYYPGAIPFTANFQGIPAALIDWRGPVYMGYQSPPMWKAIGDVPAAATDVQMLVEAQRQWRIQTGQPDLGPFAPVFYFNRSDAVQYGPANTFGWEGPDPNTKWGGYQYRPLVELAELGGSDASALGVAAKASARAFINWLAQDDVWLPLHPAPLAQWNTAMGTLISFGQDATVLDSGAPLGPPTDFPLGPAEINYLEPHMAALILRSVMLICGQNPAGLTVEDKAVLNKCLQMLDASYTASGAMAGTFTDNVAGADWFGFWHGEILTTLAMLVPFAAAAGWTDTQTSARMWINGMVQFAVNNTELSDGTVAPNPEDPVDSDPLEFSRPMITTPVNWVSAPTEEFAFATEIFTSESGREQRLSQRPEARRSLVYRFAFLDGERQRVEAMLRRFQNQTFLLPHWHMAQPILSATTGSYELTGVREWPSVFTTNVDVLISYQRRFFRGKIRYVSGSTLGLVAPLLRDWPSGTKVMPVFPAMATSDISFNHQTSKVSESSIRFSIPPQTDGASLPVSDPLLTFTVGADTREVVDWSANWATLPKSGYSWEVVPVEYKSGPTRVLITAEAGVRQYTATWDIRSTADADRLRGLLNRLKGRHRACWMPSGQSDLTLTGKDADSLTVVANSFTRSGVLLEKTTAVYLLLRDNTVRMARVSAVVTEGQASVLRLDRTLTPDFNITQVKKVSLMYRVRQSGDVASISWLTNLIGQLNSTFVTVFDDY